MQDVVIVSAVRTPIGSFGGVFKHVSAVELGASALKAAMEKITLNPADVDEVILGNVLGAGLGQNVARQVAIKAGLPIEITAYNVSKVCGSGLKSVMLAAQTIMCGDAKVVVAGGSESMSNAAYVSPATRFGARMGDTQFIDSLIKDGLVDAFSGIHMGITAENLAAKYQLTRQQLDEFALHSQQKAEQAQKSGKFNNEIVPIEIKTRKGIEIIAQDEYPKHGTTLESLTKLKPAFKNEGVVTAGNASGINDGAAILILMSKQKAQALNLVPLVTIRSFASAGVDPSIMGIGPVPATQKALQKINMSVNQLDLIEANEAFASQAICVMQDLKLDPQRVNVNGGAIALGHPIGASGARILVTLIHEMQRQNAQHGLATLCIGGGQGVAMVVSKPQGTGNE